MRRWTIVLAASALTVAAGLVAPAAATAADRTCGITWVGGASGLFDVARNWQPARVPTSTTGNVCLPLDSHPNVRLTTSMKLRTVKLGGGVLVLSPGITLSTTEVAFDGVGGGFRGAATVTVAQDIVESTGAEAALQGGVHLQTVTAYLAGSLRLQGGSSLRSYQLQVGSATVTADGDPDDLVDAGRLTALGTSSIAAPVRYTDLTMYSGRLVLAGLTGTGPDGTTALGSVFAENGAEIVVPRPISTLVASQVVLLTGATVTAASTSRSAFERLRRLVGSLDTDASLSVPGPLTIGGTDAGSGANGGSLAVRAVVSAPSVRLLDGGVVSVSGRLQLGTDGAGDLTACASTCRVGVAGGVIAGNLVQGNGTVQSPGGGATEVTGDWTSGPRAYLVLRANVGGSGATNLQVDGHATLAGDVYVSAAGGPPPVGTVEQLVTANGGLTASFRRITAPRGWTVAATATGITATYTG